MHNIMSCVRLNKGTALISWTIRFECVTYDRASLRNCFKVLGMKAMFTKTRIVVVWLCLKECTYLSNVSVSTPTITFPTM